MTIVWGHKNRSLVPGSPELLSGPYVRSRDPAPGQVDVPPSSLVLLTVASTLPRTVNGATVVITFSVNGGAPITVYSGSSFQVGYSGTATHGATALEDFIDFVIDPDVDLPESAAITVAVLAQDDAANSISPPELYTFFTAFAPPPPPPPAISPSVQPLTDSIRGGRRVLLSGQNLLDGGGVFDEALLNMDALPSGWTSSVVGTAVVQPSLLGLELKLEPTPNASALVVTDDVAFENHDLALDYELLAPAAPQPFPTDVLAFELVSPAGDVASFRLRLDARAGTNVMALTFDWTPFGGAVQTGGHILLALALRGTLRLVRNEERLWAFWATRDTSVGSVADGYVSLVPVGQVLNFVFGAATPQLRAATFAGGVAVRTRIRNYTVRAHATIAGRLLDDKQVVFHRQMIGRVPAATLADLGAQEAVIFGPAGSATGAHAFNYTLPDVMTLSAGGSAPLVTVTDPALFDGPGRKKRRGGR